MTSFSWTGTSGTDLGTAGNWNPVGLPSSVDFLNFSLNSGGVLTGTAVASSANFLGGSVWSLRQATLSLGGGVSVGANPGGSGDLEIQSGGTLTDNGTYTFVGGPTGSSGTISVSGAGALLDGTAAFIIGNSGTGVATVSDSGVVNAGTQIAVGQLNQGNGLLTIQSGGVVTGTGVVNVGNTAGSNGQLTILGGGTLELTGIPQTSSPVFFIGLNGAGTDGSGNPIPAAQGAVTVEGTGAVLDIGGNALRIGGSTGGTGSLTIAQGGSVTAGSADSSLQSALYFGNSANSNATVTVSDAGSQLTANGYLLLGRGGAATLTIENGGKVLVNDSPAGGSGVGIGSGRGAGPTGPNNFGGTGTATVTTGGVLDLNSTTSGIGVGGNGITGTLNVTNDGTVLAGTGITIGSATSAGGTIYGGTGTLNISTGGTVEVTAPAQTDSFAVTIGGANTSTDGPTTAASGVVTVSGPGSLLESDSGVAVGLFSNGSLTVSQGASVTTSTLDSNLLAALSVGKQGIGTVTVTDAGSTISATGHVYVGREGSGTLTVENEGRILIGLDPTGSSNLDIGGAGVFSGTLYVGGTGVASVTSGGQITTQGEVNVGQNGANGTLTVSTGGTIAAATLINIGDSVSVAAGTAIVSNSGTTITSGSTVVGASGTVDVGPGGLLRAGGQGPSGAADIIVGAGAGSIGVLSVAGAGAIVDSNNGSIVIGGAGNGTLNVSDGGLANAGTGDVEVGVQPGGNGLLSVGQSGMLSATTVNVGLAGAISLAGGQLIAQGSADSDVNQGMVSGFGKWLGELENDGAVIASGGTLEITGSVDGSGAITLAAGSTLRLDGAVSGGQSITFGSGTPETLILGTPGDAFVNPIQGFADGDRIEFANGATITNATVDHDNTIELQIASGGITSAYDLENVGFAANSSEQFVTGIDPSTGNSFAEMVPNLVTNSSFEDDGINFSNLHLPISGWVLSDAPQNMNAGETSTLDPALDGHGGYLAIGTVGKLGFVSQTVQTVPGATYTFQFDFSSDGAVGNEFKALWNGNVVMQKDSTPLDPRWNDVNETATYTFTETATSASTTISFGGMGNGSSYVGVDDVIVTPALSNSTSNSQITLQNTNGSAAMWQVNGTTLGTYGFVGPNPGPSWSLVGTGAFYAGDTSDYLWRGADGSVALWQVNGTTLGQSGIIAANPGTSWYIEGTGDFYGDGHTDILWQNQDGSVALWDMNGPTISQSGLVTYGSTEANPGPTWHVKGTGDFNHDGKTDIVLQNDDGSVALWDMNGTTITSGALVQSGSATANPGSDWHVEGTGDFYGDGNTDILLQNNDGSVAIWEMNGATITSGALVQYNGSTANPGSTWHVVGTGDYNGDGKTDIALRNDDGSVAVWDMNGATIAAAGVLANPGRSWNPAGVDTMRFIYPTSNDATLSATPLIANEFVLTSLSPGSQTINGFDPMQDMIELSKVQFASFTDVQAATTTAAGGAMINLGHGSSLLLPGVNPTSLHASNFAFA